MAGYTLIDSYSTVQSISPTVTNPIVYCTIQTTPSEIVSSFPVSQVSFKANGAAETLNALADHIEQVMVTQPVVAATPQQVLEDNGLLVDQMVFTVQYVQAGTSNTSVTADAVVPTSYLANSDEFAQATLTAEIDAIIQGVYANLQSAAGG